MASDLNLSPMAEQLLANITGDVSKSFTTGYNHAGLDQEGAAALRRQSLADDVKNLTFGNADFTIFPIIPRLQANSTVEEYAVESSYGETGATRFVREMGVASINDPVLERKIARMKIISDTKRQSLLSAMVNNLADPAQILQDSAISVIAKTIEEAIFFGDADLSSQGIGQGIQFDGLEKLADPANVLDLKGEVLTEQHLNKAAVLIAKGFGNPTDAFMPIGAQVEFVNNQLNRQWIMQATGVNESGFALDSFRSARGPIALHGSTIMESGSILDESLAQLPTAPSAPVSVKAMSAVGEGKFAEADLANPVEYKVRAAGDAGFSAPVGANVAVKAVNEEVTLEVTLSAITQAIPEFIEVYRKDLVSGQFYLVGRVGTYKAEAGVIKFVDKNDIIPGTAKGFVLELTARTLALYELMPMMRLDLAQVDASRTMSFLWAGATAVFAPKRVVVLRNMAYSH